MTMFTEWLCDGNKSSYVVVTTALPKNEEQTVQELTSRMLQEYIFLHFAKYIPGKTEGRVFVMMLSSNVKEEQS